MFFKNDLFIRSKSTGDLWNDFNNCWVIVNTGFQETIRLDLRSSFTSENFRNNAMDIGIDLKFRGIESNNAICQGEQFNNTLKRILNAKFIEKSRFTDALVLRLSIEAVNDTMGLDGLVPYILVLGVLPSFPCTNYQSLNQRGRFNALRTANTEMETIVTEKLIRKELKSKLPPLQIAYDFRRSSTCLPRTYRKWEGPFTLTKSTPKIISITDGKSTK